MKKLIFSLLSLGLFTSVDAAYSAKIIWSNTKDFGGIKSIPIECETYSKIITIRMTYIKGTKVYSSYKGVGGKDAQDVANRACQKAKADAVN